MLSEWLQSLNHLHLAEALGTASSFIMYHQLAYKRRSAWLYYAFSGWCIIYIMIFKEGWVTVANQTMMSVLGLKNFWAFGKPQKNWQNKLDDAALPVFLASLFLIKKIDWVTLSEVALWASIILRTIALGRGEASGWKWQMVQQALSVLFGLQQEIYLYVGRSIIQFFQAAWGYWQWTNVPPAEGKES